MELEHTFSIPVGPPNAFRFLEDVQKVARCMPGATLDSVDEEGSFTGEVAVRVGPMELAYRGRGRWIDLDEEHGLAVMEAKGRELRGNGTATASVTVEFTPEGDEVTAVRVRTELHITGRPAQFGTGMIQDVGNRVLSEFVECLKAELSSAGSRTERESS